MSERGQFLLMITYLLSNYLFIHDGIDTVDLLFFPICRFNQPRTGYIVLHR